MASLNLDKLVGNSVDGENISIEGFVLTFEPEELPELLKGALPFMKMFKDAAAEHNGKELEKLCLDYNEQGKKLSEARAENVDLKGEIRKLQFEVKQLTSKLEFEEKRRKHLEEAKTNDVAHVSLDSLDPDSPGVKLWD